MATTLTLATHSAASPLSRAVTRALASREPAAAAAASIWAAVFCRQGLSRHAGARGEVPVCGQNVELIGGRFFCSARSSTAAMGWPASFFTPPFTVAMYTICGENTHIAPKRPRLWSESLYMLWLRSEHPRRCPGKSCRRRAECCRNKRQLTRSFKDMPTFAYCVKASHVYMHIYVCVCGEMLDQDSRRQKQRRKKST